VCFWVFDLCLGGMLNCWIVVIWIFVVVIDFFVELKDLCMIVELI